MYSVWGELKRRNVVKVAVAYAIVGWLLIEIATTILPLFEAPDWIAQVFTFFVILGFPLALILSWAFDLTPQGVERTDSGSQPGSATNVAGRKLDFAIIGALVLALGFVVYNYVLNAPATSPIAEQDRPSVAALPFSNESAAEEDAEFFANGIHDELLTQLAKISSLKVISRTSVEEYRDSPKNMREIGRELDVATLLEGRVQRAGEMVRINVQLIDAETDEHLWAEVYDRELTAENLFAMQREMATAIAEALQATLSPGEVTRLNEVPTSNTRAYEFYLSGNEYFVRDQDRSADLPLAVRLYESALEEDPGFALAWTRLARAHTAMHFWSVDRTESRREQARAAVERALEFAPNLPEAHLAMGYYHYQGFYDYENALEEWDIAEQGMPGDAELHEARGYVYRRMGEMDLAAANLDRAIELSPRRLDLLTTQELLYEDLRDYTRADQILDRILEVAPDNIFATSSRLRVRLFRGDVVPVDAAREMAATAPVWVWLSTLYERDYDAALALLDVWESDAHDVRFEYRPIETYYATTYQLAGTRNLAVPYLQSARGRIERELEVSPGDPRLLIALGEVLARQGEAESATELAVRAMELPPASTDAVLRPRFHLNAIMIFLAAGEYDLGIAELGAYLSAPGAWSIEGLSRDPRLDPIREDPRFIALVEKYSR